MNQEILKEIIKQDYTKIQQDIETFLKNAVSQNKADGVIFGLSGGIDSVSVAYLSAKIFGKKALALVMPDSTISPSSETGDALKAVGELGLDYKLLDIAAIHKIYSNHLEPDELALGNLRARIRANIIYYYAKGMAQTNLKVFNRWGQMVFESDDTSYGWDGTYNGVDLEMDTYTYLLIGETLIGEVFKQKGNLSLIR